MSENIKMEDLFDKKDTSTSEESETKVETKGDVATEPKVETEQDPLKIELEKVQRKEGRTELDKAAFTLKKNAERLKELGGDPNTILGIEKETIETEDDTPVTLGMLKQLQQEGIVKTALQRADEIQNETERELVKYHLQNTIKSTGDPSEDLRLARGLVNSLKNTQILEEVSRKTPPKTHSNGSGVPPKKEEEIVFTPEEQLMMQAPFNMSPQEILDARSGKKFKFSSK